MAPITLLIQFKALIKLFEYCLTLYFCSPDGATQLASTHLKINII